MYSDNKQDSILQLQKLINSLINWEKEKEQILSKQNNNLNEKRFYLIGKNWMNDFKSSIKYDELIENYKKNRNNEKEFISFIKNNFKNLKLSSEKQPKEDSYIITSLMNKSNFVLEIINEELFDSLLNQYTKGYEALGISINKKIIFKMSIWKKKILLMLFPLESNNICEIFFILGENNEKDYQILYEEIKNSDISEILSFSGLDIKNIDEKGEKKTLKIKENAFKCFIIIKKIKFNYEFLLLEKNIIDKVNNLFYMLYESNNKFKKALINDEICGNYSPCKILSKKWMDDFIYLFNYTEKDKYSFDEKIYKNSYEKLVQNIPNITNDDIENGDFYILNENFIKILKYIMSETFSEDDYKNYDISLKNNKGAIIINDNLYIFETKNHINQRFNYEKIKEEKKFEYLYKMEKPKKEFNFELTDEVWNRLKSNLNENENKAIKTKINMNINKLRVENQNFHIDNSKKDLLIISERKELKILKEKDIKKELEKERELKVKIEELNKKEKELNKRDKELNIQEDKLKKKDNELIKKDEELNSKYREKENKLNEKEEKLNKKEEELNEKEKNLNKKENDLKEKEIELNNKGKEFNNKEIRINKELNDKEEKILTIKNKELDEKEEKLNKRDIE